MENLNDSQETCKQKLQSILNNSKLIVKVDGVKDTLSIMDIISDFLEIQLQPNRYKNYWWFLSNVSHFTGTVYLTASVVDSQPQKFIDFSFSTEIHDVNYHYTADEIERMFTDEEIDNTDSLCINLLREFGTTYGIELSITSEGWLVVDGTNEAILTDGELVRYMAAYESIKDIMLKFER